ncbi:hypothetical protein GOBAR_DD01700 [Gossypium barbadense]|nr:hypothetical protein GOBAR_DD01700 [Gossypium barbadense]
MLAVSEKKHLLRCTRFAEVADSEIDSISKSTSSSLNLRAVNEGGSHTRKVDAVQYIKLLRVIFIPSHGASEMLEVHGETDTSMVSFNEFLIMFNDPDWGFGILSTLLKLETGDRNRHERHLCSVYRYPIIGSRSKEVKSHFKSL